MKRSLPFRTFTPALLAALLLAGASARAQTRAAPPGSPNLETQCPALPALRMPPSFPPGETLDFDLDAVGAKAGTMTFRALPAQRGLLPIEVQVQTNTFFSKVRRVKGSATSYLKPRTLRPARYVEDATENDLHRSAEVTFNDKDHAVALTYNVNGVPGQRSYRPLQDALDNVGAIALLRQLPFAPGLPLCADVYAIRRLWRLTGSVVGREHVSLPTLGEFEAWHLQGVAVRKDEPTQRREIHLWISDDARRLPLVAVGAIDLGAVRATLTSFNRPHEKRAPTSRSNEMKW